MAINNQKVGAQIARLRNAKGMTQSDLGERLHVSFQAVSKWERGETLPDVAVLPDLAAVLETTIDNILLGGDSQLVFKGTIKAQDMIDGINCLKRMGELLGRQNLIYRHAVDGINNGMNTDIEEAFEDDRIFECFVAEAIIQNLKAGYYIDLTDVKRHFKHEHFRNMICDYAKKYAIM